MIWSLIPELWLRPLNGALTHALGIDTTVDGTFAAPARQAALVSAHSVSWKILKNPLALFVGGSAAVLLELAEPSVRAAIWQHSTFRSNPLGRLRRTAFAAMVTIYGARSVAEPLIARVARIHQQVHGTTDAGVAYSATDPQLLNWVHTTASFGFAAAYGRYVAPLDAATYDSYCEEAEPVAQLYGARGAPHCAADMRRLFDAMRPTLSASPVIYEYLRIMSDTPLLPKAVRWLQPVLMRAAVDVLPPWVRERLGLGAHYGLRSFERKLVCVAGRAADQLILKSSPAVQSCLRMGLPADHLYKPMRTAITAPVQAVATIRSMP